MGYNSVKIERYIYPSYSTYVMIKMEEDKREAKRKELEELLAKIDARKKKKLKMMEMANR